MPVFASGPSAQEATFGDLKTAGAFGKWIAPTRVNPTVDELARLRTLSVSCHSAGQSVLDSLIGRKT